MIRILNLKDSIALLWSERNRAPPNFSQCFYWVMTIFAQSIVLLTEKSEYHFSPCSIAESKESSISGKPLENKNIAIHMIAF